MCVSDDFHDLPNNKTVHYYIAALAAVAETMTLRVLKNKNKINTIIFLSK